MIHVLFLCLGNICRSPMAEAIFKRMVEGEGLSDRVHVDSAGTGSWHVGERAHQGTRRVLRQHGIHYEGRARQIEERDVEDDAYIIAMSQSNIDEFRRRFGAYPRLHRLLDFAENGDVRDVPDPYYTGNFELVYRLIEDGCRGFLSYIRQQENI